MTSSNHDSIHRLAGNHGLKLSANLSLMFTEVEFSSRPAAALESGFDAVEYWPTDDVEAGISAARSAGIPVALLNVPTGAAGQHGRLIHRESIQWWREAFLRTVGQAEETGCEYITVITGNCEPGVERAEYEDVIRQNLTFAIDTVRGTDIRILLEPLNPNDRPSHFLLSLDQAAALVEEFDSSNLRILFDAYHIAQTESDLTAAFTRVYRNIGYVQVADVPGRHEPGSGTIDFPALLWAATGLGYEGYIGCEFQPQYSTASSVEVLRSLFKALPSS